MTSGNSYKYKVSADPKIPAAGTICQGGYTNWDGVSEIAAQSGQKIVIVEVDDSNVCVGVGITDVTVSG